MSWLLNTLPLPHIKHELSKVGIHPPPLHLNHIQPIVATFQLSHSSNSSKNKPIQFSTNWCIDQLDSILHSWYAQPTDWINQCKPQHDFLWSHEHHRPHTIVQEILDQINNNTNIMTGAPFSAGIHTFSDQKYWVPFIEDELRRRDALILLPSQQPAMLWSLSGSIMTPTHLNQIWIERDVYGDDYQKRSDYPTSSAMRLSMLEQLLNRFESVQCFVSWQDLTQRWWIAQYPKRQHDPCLLSHDVMTAFIEFEMSLRQRRILAFRCNKWYQAQRPTMVPPTWQTVANYINPPPPPPPLDSFVDEQLVEPIKTMQCLSEPSSNPTSPNYVPRSPMRIEEEEDNKNQPEDGSVLSFQTMNSDRLKLQMELESTPNNSNGGDVQSQPIEKRDLIDDDTSKLLETILSSL